jgi:uncharacterized membrane protein
MVLFGLVLVILGVLLALAGLFGTGYDYDSHNNFQSTQFLGINVDPAALVVIGIIAGALVVIGLWIMKVGAQLGWKHRKEQKRLNELSEKLDRAEAERRARGDVEDEDAGS